MTVDNYNNAYNYPYQQSSMENYSAYQTAPASNHASQQSRQYQPSPSTATTEPTNYMSYPTQAYSAQGNRYSTNQNNSWDGNNYATTREMTSRVAEVLSNMSNTAYTPNHTSTPQVQTQQPHSTQLSYEQTQARPRSVNTYRTQTTTSRGLPLPVVQAGYPLQRAQDVYNQQQHHSESSVHSQYSRTAVAFPSSTRDVVTNTESQHQIDHNHRQLPSVEVLCMNQDASVSNSYGYADRRTISPHSASVDSLVSVPNVPETDTTQNTTTVDPMAVYDPWPEYQRKQEALRAKKALEDAARADEEKMAEEARQVEERKREEERTRQEQEENKQQEQTALNQPEPKKKTERQSSNKAETILASEASTEDPNELEVQIRAMMAKMRELNNKDPALLARIWEEERRAKAPMKSPVVQTKSTPQPATMQLAQTVTVAAPPIANQSKKTVPRESIAANSTKLAPPVPTQLVPASPRAQAIAHSGNTIWPPERKTSLANVATVYLNGSNPNNTLDASQILGILDSNPSYIELCEQLEQKGLTLDRAAFAKTLLSAVPDVNSAPRRTVPQPTIQVNSVQDALVPVAKLKKNPVAANVRHASATTSPAPGSSYQTFLDDTSVPDPPAPVVEMVPVKADLNIPTSKEEAARKRNLSDLVDLTQLSDDEDIGPPLKKLNMSATSSGLPRPRVNDTVNRNNHVAVNNFPTAAIPSRPVQQLATHIVHLPQNEPRYRSIVQPLDRKKALRRNTYNPATIARDVLLACGRYPGERQLNQHLEILKQNIPQITNDSDLSTIKWDLIDPGSPPPGYFVSSVQALTEDADDEDEEDRTRLHTTGGESGAQARVQALPQAINPFTKQKRRGRPPRQSLPNQTLPTTPNRPSDPVLMSSSVPHTSGVGYSAFRADLVYGEDGKPLPKKKGRPVGWRKAIHGSPAANARVRHEPAQPSGLRNVRTDGEHGSIRVDSRSPGVTPRNLQHQSYRCRWQNCSAELHNLQTLKKHALKVHRKVTLRDTLECLWGDCTREVTSSASKTNTTIEHRIPLFFSNEKAWREHIEKIHLDPLSWQLGDGPASGLSDTHDSDAYLSDAQGRRVTPRIEVDPKRLAVGNSSVSTPAPAPHGRGRPLKAIQEQEARDLQNRLVSQKKRMGGPGMDRGGATLVNDKRRRGLSDEDESEGVFVDAED